MPSSASRRPPKLGRVDGYFVSPADVRSENDFTRFGVVLASDGRAGYGFSRPKILDGRLPRRDAANEVLINPELARREHLSVGDRVAALGFSREATESTDAPAAPTGSLEEQIRRGRARRARRPLRSQGVGDRHLPRRDRRRRGLRRTGDAPLAGVRPRTSRRRCRLLRASRRGCKGGERGIPAFRRAVEAMVPDEAIAFQTTRSTEAKVERAVQPQVGALTIFAIVIASHRAPRRRPGDRTSELPRRTRPLDVARARVFPESAVPPRHAAGRPRGMRGRDRRGDRRVRVVAADADRSGAYRRARPRSALRPARARRRCARSGAARAGALDSRGVALGACARIRRGHRCTARVARRQWARGEWRARARGRRRADGGGAGPRAHRGADADDDPVDAPRGHRGRRGRRRRREPRSPRRDAAPLRLELGPADHGDATGPGGDRG